MEKFLTKINYSLGIEETRHDINVNSRILIVTGGNGCGKTSLLNQINSKIKTLCVEKKHSQISDIQRDIKYWEEQLNSFPRGNAQHQNAKNQLKYQRESLNSLEKGVTLEFKDINEISALLDEKKAIFNYFQADRKATILESIGATKVSLQEKLDKNYAYNNMNLGNEFENHLVNLKTRQSFAKTFDNNESLYESMETWFINLEKSISFLMEDESFKLIFDPDKFKFHLQQDSKPPYTFQTLSSGYSSIFNILSELIMMTEANHISPSDLQGIVLIDEIDAHLHVSLQRKILPFLTRTYPRIQFIVTTHSPFVIGSLDNAIIYDLSSQQEFSDLSNYSYETIIEGLLGVPVVSISLEKDTKRLSALLVEENVDNAAITELVEKLSPHQENLDDESAVFLLKARRVLREDKETK